MPCLEKIVNYVSFTQKKSALPDDWNVEKNELWMNMFVNSTWNSIFLINHSSLNDYYKFWMCKCCEMYLLMEYGWLRTYPSEISFNFHDLVRILLALDAKNDINTDLFYAKNYLFIWNLITFVSLDPIIYRVASLWTLWFWKWW